MNKWRFWLSMRKMNETGEDMRLVKTSFLLKMTSFSADVHCLNFRAMYQSVFCSPLFVILYFPQNDDICMIFLNQQYCPLFQIFVYSPVPCLNFKTLNDLLHVCTKVIVKYLKSAKVKLLLSLTWNWFFSCAYK